MTALRVEAINNASIHIFCKLVEAALRQCCWADDKHILNGQHGVPTEELYNGDVDISTLWLALTRLEKANIIKRGATRYSLYGDDSYHPNPAREDLAEHEKDGRAGVVLTTWSLVSAILPRAFWPDRYGEPSLMFLIGADGNASMTPERVDLVGRKDHLGWVRDIEAHVKDQYPNETPEEQQARIYEMCRRYERRMIEEAEKREDG
jgi:hypothetical protein